MKNLKGSAVPKCEIKNITNHTSKKGLDDYDSGDENELQMISNIIDGSKTSIQTFQGEPVLLQPHATPVRSAMGNVFNFNNCNVMLNVAGDHSAQASSSQTPKVHSSGLFSLIPTLIDILIRYNEVT